MRERDGLKNIWIGQSATKPRTGEGSTTIPEGSRRHLVNASEVVGSSNEDEDIVYSYMKV